MLTIGPLKDLPRVRHAFFTRNGGVSSGIYESLNCGFGSDDDCAKVAENRARAMAKIEIAADRLVTPYQVHSNRVAVLDRPLDRASWPEVDALVTRESSLALGVLAMSGQGRHSSPHSCRVFQAPPCTARGPAETNTLTDVATCGADLTCPS